MSTGRPGIATGAEVLTRQGRDVTFKIVSEEDAEYFKPGDTGGLAFWRDSVKPALVPDPEKSEGD